MILEKDLKVIYNIDLKIFLFINVFASKYIILEATEIWLLIKMF